MILEVSPQHIDGVNHDLVLETMDRLANQQEGFPTGVHTV